MYAADDTTNRKQTLSGGAVSGVSKTLAAVKRSSNNPVNTILLENIDSPRRKKLMEEKVAAANSSTDPQQICQTSLRYFPFRHRNSEFEQHF